MNKRIRAALSALLCCVMFTLPKAAVAIGSEGRGLSQQMLDECAKTLKIPMSPRCESLNAAIAATVVLWEMYR